MNNLSHTNGWSAVNANETSRIATFNVGNGPATLTVKARGILGCAGIESIPLSLNLNVTPTIPVIARIDAGCIAIGRPDTITLSVQNQGTMPAGTGYAWVVPAGWEALPPDAATTQVITDGITGNYTVSATANDAVCGGNTGSLGVNITNGVNTPIREREFAAPDPNDPTDLGSYTYIVSNTPGVTYTWVLYNRTTGAFISTPIRRRPAVPTEVYLDLPEGFGAPLRSTDSLVVEIRESSGCVTTLFALAETVPPFSTVSSARSADSGTEYLFDVNEIEEESGNNEFSIYPNPAREKITIEWPKAKEAQLLKVAIIDVYGSNQKIIEVKGKKKVEIDTSDLAPSTYVVLTKSDKGVAYEKLIKN